jgi:hypothetical protein
LTISPLSKGALQEISNAKVNNNNVLILFGLLIKYKTVVLKTKEIVVCCILFIFRGDHETAPGSHEQFNE